MRKIGVLMALLLAACGQSAEPASQATLNQAPTHGPTVTNAAPPSAATATRISQLPATQPPPAAGNPPEAAAPTATLTAAPPPTASPEPPTATPSPLPAVTPTPPAAPGPGFILFNRQGAIWRFEVATGAEQKVIERGSHFRSSPDGAALAYVADAKLYLAKRDGSAPVMIAENVASAPAWAPDSGALAVTTGLAEPAGTVACNAANAILVIEISGAATPVGSGCQPAWSPESKRIAYITALEGDAASGTNALRLVNRQGANGWSPVKGPVTGGGYPNPRRIFYAPFWSADGKQLYAFGFDGYHALTDFSTLELIDPTNGGSEPIGVAFDVIGDTVRPSGNGASVAFETASAKGTAFVGSLLTNGPPATFDYFGTPVAIRTQEGPATEYGTAPAWAPDGQRLAVVYCAGDGYVCPPAARADVRVIGPNGADQALINDVDPASDLEWHR